MSLFFFNFFEKLCEEQFDLLCCWSIIIAFEHCVWRIEFELFSEKLFVILTFVTISRIIYEIIWFIELWFVFRFASLIVFRSLKLKMIFSMNKTSILNLFRDALMIAKKIWFEFWIAISNIVSKISLFICVLIIALFFSEIFSIFFDFFRFDFFYFCVRYSNVFYCFFDSFYRSFVRDFQMTRRENVFVDDWNHDFTFTK